MAKKALGRGLDALLSTSKPEDNLTSGLLESTEDKSLSLVEQIEIHKIQSGKHQPREIFNEEDLKSLHAKLTEAEIDHKLWIEQPENFPTCLAVRPYVKDQVQQYFKKLKLFRD